MKISDYPYPYRPGARVRHRLLGTTGIVSDPCKEDRYIYILHGNLESAYSMEYVHQYWKALKDGIIESD